ncbi:MAG: acyl-CoA dehydrogenase family protein, partial [Caulobacterales bacterium]
MIFEHSEETKLWLGRLKGFIAEHVEPAVPVYYQQRDTGERWKVLPIIEELKAKAKKAGLWNMFMPPEPHGFTPVDTSFEFEGPGLSNLTYAPLAEQMGRIEFASEIFNSSAPDTGNMEVLVRYGTREQKEQWLRPLMNGEIRSVFLMTEPGVASSDATNVETSIVRDGDHYVVNGRKWWSSGAGDPRCTVFIVMGKTDPEAARHLQQTMILVPSDSRGIRVVRPLSIFGYDDAPHGHMEVVLENVRVP